MQASPVTTTTTTTASTKTVSWSYDNGGCSGRSGSITKNGTTSIFSGTFGSGTFTVAIGDTITVTDTTGPKATGFICTNASALIGSTLGGGDYASNSATGVSVTATATYIITGATASTIYMQGGPNFA